MGLDYAYPTDGTKACTKKPMKVSYNGKKHGEIKKVKDGYQFTAADNTKGHVFETISLVQKDLSDGQPTRTPFSVKKDDEDGTAVKKAMKQNAKLEADLKHMTLQVESLTPGLERANVLLSAALEIMGKQKDSKIVLNILEQTAEYDDSKCDGFCLIEDIVDHLGS